MISDVYTNRRIFKNVIYVHLSILLLFFFSKQNDLLARICIDKRKLIVKLRVDFKTTQQLDVFLFKTFHLKAILKIIKKKLNDIN